MKKLLMFVAVLLVAAIPGKAQHNYPGFEIFRGYSYLNVDAISRDSFHGWGVSFAGDVPFNCARAIVR